LKEREQEDTPIRERPAVVDSLPTDSRAQLQRPQDLNISRDFSTGILVDRKAWPEVTVEAFEKERASLSTHLEAQLLTSHQKVYRDLQPRSPRASRRH
jgi:hypothetical protein